VKDTTRGYLLEWIIDVHRKHCEEPETLFIAVSIIDRFLSKVSIKKQQLQLLGIAAIFVSSKYEEIYALELKDLISLAKY
jgi:cyclin B